MIHPYLDDAGQLDLRRHLDDIPDVVVALAGVCSDGYRPRISYEPKVHGSATPPMPYDPTASDAARDLNTALAEVVWLIVDHHPNLTCDSGTTPVGMAGWITRHLSQLAVIPGSQDTPTRIGQAVKQARRAARMTSRPETWRMQSVHVAAGKLLNARGIETAAKELGPNYTRLDRKRVHNLHRLGHITPVREHCGELLFRLGDVMDAHREARAFRKHASGE